MTFYAFGLNYETAPLAIRERFALGAESNEQLLRSLQLSESAEVVLLSTCNRTEGYLFGNERDVARVKEALASAAAEVWPSEHAFDLEDEAAVKHLLRVTAGLKSMVVGDVQILAQMKDAYRLAVDADRVGTVVHRLMHTAFRTAKRVLSSTGIGTGSVSVSSAAVALARAHFGESFSERRVVLMGTGSVGRLVLRALRDAGPASIGLVNRSREHAEAANLDGCAEVYDWADRHRALSECDLAIVATAADCPVIRADAVLARPADGESLVIDLGVPRNVDAHVDRIPGFRVVDMDALETWTKRVEAERKLELPKAEEIVDEELAEFVSWMFHQQALQPAIQAIRSTFEAIRRQEIDRHYHRFQDADRAALDQLTRSILQKLLSVPIVRLKASDPEHVDLAHGVRLLASFFSRPDCDDEAVVDAGPSVPEVSTFNPPIAIPASSSTQARA